MKVIEGDITSVTNGIIVQQVNAMGLMNSGIARAIRAKWPAVWEVYSKHVWEGVPPHERLNLLGTAITCYIDQNLSVVSIVGQESCYREGDPKGIRYTSYDALDLGLSRLAKKRYATTLHLPMIGCGLGGGHWPIVKEIVSHRLAHADVTIWTKPASLESKQHRAFDSGI